MKSNLKEKLNYKLEQFLSKGPSALFVGLALTFLIVYFFLVVLRILLIYLFPSLYNPETLTNTNENIAEILYFFNELFSESGSEIYVKPSEYYFSELPIKYTFLSLMIHVNKRNEICLGIRKGKYSHSLNRNFGVVLNPRKDEDLEITKHDFIIVLSEDDS